MVAGEAVELGDVVAGGDGVDDGYAVLTKKGNGQSLQKVGGVIGIGSGGNGILVIMNLGGRQKSAGAKSYQFVGLEVKNGYHKFIGVTPERFLKVAHYPFLRKLNTDEGIGRKAVVVALSQEHLSCLAQMYLIGREFSLIRVNHRASFIGIGSVEKGLHPELAETVASLLEGVNG